MTRLQDTILLAVKYINENRNNGENVYPRYKTITSFLKGTKNSSNFSIFSKYLDVCGKYPNIKWSEVHMELNSLVKKGLLRLDGDDYSIIKVSNITDKKSTGNELAFSKVEQLLVDEIINYTLSLNIYFSINEKKRYIGVVYKDNIFNFVWISRNKNNSKLEVKIRKSFTLESDSYVYELKKNNIISIKSSITTIVKSKKEIIKDYETRIKSKTDRFNTYNHNEIYKTIELMPHQKAGVELAEQFNKFAFFYDTGTGKTIMALEIMSRKYLSNRNKFLVVAPKPLIKVAWLDDAEKFPNMKLLPLSSDIKGTDYLELYNKWLPTDKIKSKFKVIRDENGIILNKISSEEKEYLINVLSEYAEHFIVNIDRIREPKQMRKFMDKYNFDSLIVDESSIIKNYDSQNASRIRVISKKMKNVYLLSGKPAPNTEAEYYSQMCVVAPEIFNMTYNKFLAIYFEQKKFKLVPKNKSSKEIVADMVSNASLTISKEDCLDLPEQKVIKVNFKLSKEYKEKYDNVLEKIVTIFITEDNKKEVVKGLQRLALITKLRELTSGFIIDNNGDVKDFNSDKINKFLEVLDYRIGSEKQVIIWCNFKHERDKLLEALESRGCTVVTADGQTNNLSENIYKFKSGRAQYLIANMKTLKYGVTLTNCYNSVFFSLSYSFEDYYQACARVHRKSLKEPCFVYILSAIDTIDTIITKCIDEKNDKTVIFEKLIKSFCKFNEKITLEKIESEIDKKIDVAEVLLDVD